MELNPGTMLQQERYRIIRSLGQGGFGITYLAEQVLADRQVCIKEFFPKEYYNRDEDSCNISLGSQGSREFMERFKEKFMKEAKTIARLDHPNIIHIFDVFKQNNTGYYVMEYIDGESLHDMVKRRGALAEDEAKAYILQLASALKYIHSKNITHLDVKPGNIMVRKDNNRAILIDFGLSKQYDDEGGQTSSTPVGISQGFAPMEQYTGGVSEFSPATDIYSMAATLYYLTTGMMPPKASDVAEDGLPALPTHLSEGVRRAIERGMESRKKARPQSVDEFLQIMEGESASAAATQIAMPNEASAATQVAQPKQVSTPKSEQTPVQPSKPEPKPAPRVEPKPAETPKTPTPAPKKSSKAWLWIVLAVLLIVGGVGGWLILGQGKEESATQYASSPEMSDSGQGSVETVETGITGDIATNEANDLLEWTVEANYLGDNTYNLIFTADIDDGYHIFSLNDFLCPPIFNYNFEEGVTFGKMTEKTTPVKEIDEFGETIEMHYNQAIFEQTVKITDNTEISGLIMTTLCNQDRQCVANECEFAITLTIPREAKTAKTEQQRIDNMVAQGLGRDGVYQVGDYYNRGGKQGVVFEVWNGGRNGKIVSLDEALKQWCTDSQWDKEIVTGAKSETDGKANTDRIMRRSDSSQYPAFVWCRNKGNGWYLPAKDELKAIYKAKDKINNTMSKCGGESIHADDWSNYWTSTEDSNDGFCAWLVLMSVGDAYDLDKYRKAYVRAVSAF